jgi:histidinol-phosphate phosphatase family protein
VLAQVGGFDERFPRAYREDADLALRVLDSGFRLVRGTRRTAHPVRPADRWVSVRMQAGNASDPLMRALHGPDWRARAEAPRGRRPWHLAVTACAATALAAAAARRPRAAAAAALGWAAGTADFAARRIAPGPRTTQEVLTMAVTSAAIPPAATWHWLRGVAQHRQAPAWQPPPEAVLLDRDGTLVVDVSYNGDPVAVRPMPGAREAVDRLRRAGIRLGVVTNQSGIARGMLTRSQVDAVNARVDELLGPFDTWQVCEHGPQDGCGCRKPAPGMVKDGAARLDVPVERCAVVGDIGADVEAARAAGARAILVPTAVTRTEEVAAAPVVARDLAAAVDLLLRGRPW